MSCEAHGLAKSRREISEEMVDLLRHLAEDLPTGGTVVDLGTGSGTALLSILAERNDAIHIHTYDLDVQWGQAVVNNERVARVGDVTFYRGDILAEDVPFRGEHGIDLLLVDLLPERTEEILNHWLPMLNPRARVWVHNAELVMVKGFLEALVAEDVFPIITLDTRDKSWVGAVKEITMQTVAERNAEDGTPADDAPTEETKEEEVPPSQPAPKDQDQSAEETPSQPKRAPKKRSPRKSTE